MAMSGKDKERDIKSVRLDGARTIWVCTWEAQRLNARIASACIAVNVNSTGTDGES